MQTSYSGIPTWDLLAVTNCANHQATMLPSNDTVCVAQCAGPSKEPLSPEKSIGAFPYIPHSFHIYSFLPNMLASVSISIGYHLSVGGVVMARHCKTVTSLYMTQNYVCGNQTHGR